jgi:hypothetical protein
MSDFVIAQIRTYVPMLAGFLITWLIAANVLDPDTAVGVQAGLVSFATAVLSGLYYFIVRLLAEKWPQVGILLGVNKAPDYKA